MTNDRTNNEWSSDAGVNYFVTTLTKVRGTCTKGYISYPYSNVLYQTNQYQLILVVIELFPGKLTCMDLGTTTKSNSNLTIF